jgi:predicted RNase H-like nuclease
MPIVLGVDGCPHGWCAVALDTETLAHSAAHYPDFAVLLADFPQTTIAIDVPIGLLDRPGGRDCDRAARKLLGPGKGSSVFSPPARKTLRWCGKEENYERACSVNYQSNGRKISKQSFWIGPKVREVDDAMRARPALQRRVFEVHPEVAFAAMAGRAMQPGKRTAAGKQERWAVLRRRVPRLRVQASLPPQLRRLCDLEDYIDALACAWTARSISLKQARSLPEKPPRDAVGLRMAIWVAR